MCPDSPPSTDGTGLPDELLRILRDQSVIIPQHQAVFEAIARDVEVSTASAMTVDEWRKAWVVTYEALAAGRERTRVLEEALRDVLGHFPVVFPDNMRLASIAYDVLDKIEETVRSSLAAVAVEDGDLSTSASDNSTTTTQVARQLEEAEQVLARSRETRSRGERTLAETQAALDWARRNLGLPTSEPSAAGTLAAEPPINPKENER